MKIIKSFIYVCMLFVSAVAWAQELPFTINADTFSYSENGEEFIAEGKVYVFNEDNALKADKLVYNKAKDKLIATGEVILIDDSNTTTYTDKLELTGTFKTGLAKHMIIMFNEGSGVLQSSKAVKISENKTNLFNVDYSSCPLKEGEARPWSIKAEKVSYNSEKEYIIYRNAVFNIKDIPVMYVPMFYHSTNKDKPVTGFLNPGLASSSSDGIGFKSGFFWAIDQNQDATMRFTYLGKRGVILGLEHRYQGEHLSSKFNIEGLEDKQFDKHARGFLKASAEYVFDQGERIGLNANLPSDEDYLEEFKDISDAYTSSTIYAEKADENSYIGYSSRYFVDMRDNIDDDKLAQPVARLQLEKLYSADEDGAQVKLSSDILSLIRNDGRDMNRVVSNIAYTKPFYSSDGSLFEFDATLRADYYSFNDNTTNSSNETESKFLPQASISWEKPFVSNDFDHIITPKLMLITSQNVEFDDTPNEDSTSFELDAANLFENNRFSGLDRAETGTRVVYGVDTKYGAANSLNLQAFLGQSYNFSSKEEYIADGITSNNKNSDIVGFVRLNPNSSFSARTNFRLDSDSLSTQRLDSSVKLSKFSKYSKGFALEKDYVELVHSFLKSDSEELNLYGYYNLNEDLALRARIQRNMYENITLTQELEAIYHSCCYNLSFKIRKDQSDDDDTEDSIDFLVNFSILPTGRK